MGIKGAKLNQESILSAELLAKRLDSIEDITTKKMFGGHGIFRDGKMFGIVDSKGNCFFKVDASNKAGYEKHKATQHSRMPYFSLPKQIFDQQDDLINWAKMAIAASK